MGEPAGLRRAYTSLGLGELSAAAVFALVAVSGALPVARSGAGQRALWSALIPLLVILVQAGVYWLLARRWVGRAPMPAAIAAAYRLFRVLDPVLLAAGLAGAVVFGPSGGGAVLVAGVWLLGVVEYVNYFVVRLAYPLRQWPSRVTRWRTPQLVQDLDAAV
jgi:hypothetical protein